MQHIICPFEVKNDPGTTDGIVAGYGSIFGNIDSYGDVVAPGAFKKTIRPRCKRCFWSQNTTARRCLHV
jgi:phage head maturation protease